MNREEFKARLEEYTQLKLKALGVSLMPSNLWMDTKLFEDSVKAVLRCGEVLLSVGWDYLDDSSFIVGFIKNSNFSPSESEMSTPLNGLLTPEGNNAWMNPTVRTVRGEKLVELTILFSAPQFDEFAQTFFTVLGSELDRRFKLDEGTIFEVFKRQNYNFFARKTDLLEHTLLEVLGYTELPEDCVTTLVGNTLKIDLKTPQDIDPDAFKKALQLACEKIDEIQVSDAKENKFDYSLYIPETVLNDLDERFFSALKKKLENPELNRIYSEWSLSNDFDKRPFLDRLRKIKVNAQKEILSVNRVAETVNLIVNGNSFSVSGRNDAEQETLTQAPHKFKEAYSKFLAVSETILSLKKDRKATPSITFFKSITPLLNMRRKRMLPLAMVLLDYKESRGIDSSILVLKGLFGSLPPVDHSDKNAITTLNGFAEDLMPLIKKVVCENQVGAKAAWELYIHLLGQANNIVKYQQTDSFKHLIPFHKEFSCQEQLDAAFLIAYIASEDVEGAKKFFYGHEKFPDYKRELQEMTLKKFDSLVDKVKQMDLKAFFDGSLSFKDFLLELLADRSEYLERLVQTKTSVNTRSSFYKATSHVSGSSATNVAVEPTSSVENRAM
jgi:hypothetical protein